MMIAETMKITMMTKKDDRDDNDEKKDDGDDEDRKKDGGDK